MKAISLAILVLLSFGLINLALAGTCRVIEYAELKDTSTENLRKTFCRY